MPTDVQTIRLSLVSEKLGSDRFHKFIGHRVESVNAQKAAGAGRKPAICIIRNQVRAIAAEPDDGAVVRSRRSEFNIA